MLGIIKLVRNVGTSVYLDYFTIDYVTYVMYTYTPTRVVHYKMPKKTHPKQKFKAIKLLQYLYYSADFLPIDT